MASRPRPDFGPLLVGVSRELKRVGIPFMLIGGQAVLLHGAPRLTLDIDVTVGVGPEELAAIQDVCDALGLRILVEDPLSFARETFVCPARHESSGVRMDFIFSNTAYEQVAIDRAIRIDMEGEAIPFAAAEDLILLKLFSGRPRDIDDARSVASRQGPKLDWSHIKRWAAQFAAIPGRERLPDQVRKLQSESRV